MAKASKQRRERRHAQRRSRAEREAERRREDGVARYHPHAGERIDLFLRGAGLESRPQQSRCISSRSGGEVGVTGVARLRSGQSIFDGPQLLEVAQARADNGGRVCAGSNSADTLRCVSPQVSDALFRAHRRRWYTIPEGSGLQPGVYQVTWCYPEPGVRLAPWVVMEHRRDPLTTVLSTVEAGWRWREGGDTYPDPLWRADGLDSDR